MPTDQPVLAVDFDGTVTQYRNGWEGATTITDPPTDGVADALGRLQAAGWRILIFSTRANDPEAVPVMEAWLKEHGVPFDEISVGGKPKAKAYIDDRAIRFKNNWAELAQALEEGPNACVPWNREPGSE